MALLRSSTRPRPRFRGRLLHIFATLILVIANHSLVICRVFAGNLADSARRPNIVLILADDLGYGDLGCYGHPVVKTPHLDRFASQGVRLTQCYSAAANCSPARCGLLTGRTPYRVGIHSQIPFLSPMHLRTSEITIATLLSNAGYDTCHSGKWHLNGMFNLPGQPQPSDHGFRHWFSTQNNCLPNHHNPYNFVRNGIPVGPQASYASQIVVDDAIDWLRSGRDAAKPFFLYLCFHEPHEPIRTSPEFAALYAYLDDPSRAAHHGNITQMDAAFGRLLAALDELKLADDTLVWFTSDNGPERTKWHNTGSTGGLRAWKGHVYEGGIRVPGIVRWPKHVPAGKVSPAVVSGLDVLPTVCEAVGLDPPADRKLDGHSRLAVLQGSDEPRTKPLYWQFNFAHSDEKLALRDGDWKIVARLTATIPRARASITAEANHVLKHAEPAEFQLYNLADDPAETNDLADSHAEQLAKLQRMLIDYFHEVRNETPVWPLWDDPAYEQSRIEWPAYTAKPLAAPTK